MSRCATRAARSCAQEPDSGLTHSSAVALSERSPLRQAPRGKLSRVADSAYAAGGAALCGCRQHVARRSNRASLGRRDCVDRHASADRCREQCAENQAAEAECPANRASSPCAARGSGASAASAATSCTLEICADRSAEPDTAAAGESAAGAATDAGSTRAAPRDCDCGGSGAATKHRNNCDRSPRRANGCAVAEADASADAAANSRSIAATNRCVHSRAAEPSTAR